MVTRATDVVVVGAGVVGVAAAHYLARRGARVALIDSRPALSLTSSLSTECYRSYWAGHAAMTAFMNRSIDLLEERATESGNAFSMNRRGYCFLTKTAEGAARHASAALTAGGLVHADGAHGVTYRGHELSYDDARTSDVTAFQGAAAIGAFFESLPPFVATDEMSSLLHCGRCGWMNAQQMGSTLLEQARATGSMRTLIPATLVGLDVERTGAAAADGAGTVRGVLLRSPDSADVTHIRCGAVVNCAGPFAASVNTLLLGAAGADEVGGGAPTPPPGTPVTTSAASAASGPLPLENEVHAKAVLRDPVGAVPQEAPMMIFEDEVSLPWTPDERADLLSMGAFEASLVRPLAGGAHFRPYPGATGSLLMLWEALHAEVAVAEPPPAVPELNPLFAELVLRGLSPMAPGLARYFDESGSMAAHVAVDGGYYTKTPDNLPLVGPLPGGAQGTYVCAGFSGYGVMAANAAGDLLASHVLGEPLPAAYAPAFLPERWWDAGYRERVATGAEGKGLQI